jgi:hypothetical protein
LEITPTDSEELKAAWQRAAEASLEKSGGYQSKEAALGPEQWLLIIRCRDERHQVELLGRFAGEGLECRAVMG